MRTASAVTGVKSELTVPAVLPRTWATVRHWPSALDLDVPVAQP